MRRANRIATLSEAMGRLYHGEADDNRLEDDRTAGHAPEVFAYDALRIPI